jgi:hypothetical protein
MYRKCLLANWSLSGLLSEPPDLVTFELLCRSPFSRVANLGAMNRRALPSESSESFEWLFKMAAFGMIIVLFCCRFRCAKFSGNTNGFDVFGKLYSFCVGWLAGAFAFRDLDVIFRRSASAFRKWCDLGSAT